MKPYKKMLLQIVALAVGLLLVCLFYRLALHGRYTDFIEIPEEKAQLADLDFRMDHEGVMEEAGREEIAGQELFHLMPEEEGEVTLVIRDSKGKTLEKRRYYVSRSMTVINRSTGGFTGDTVLLVAMTVFCLATGIIMLRYFLHTHGPAFYSYTTLYTAGFSIFALTAGFMMLVVTIRHILHPVGFSMLQIYSAIQSTSYQFILVTSPLILLFSGAMCVSNVELLRHERRRFRNVLGILISVVMIAGAALAIWMYTRDYSGPEFKAILMETGMAVYATVYVYFECVLLGAVICGVISARYVPEARKNYCIILGCGFRKDGSLTPLLKGRVDRAIDFADRQMESTGQELIFVPSGGQGANESMTESEAMSRYLLSCGIPEGRILRETRSRNTYENMAFSKKVIEKNEPTGKASGVLFATTNYHVFRSGVWAGLAGLEAEGIGSSTKWWFWPNAFVRECIGLMQNRWKQELLGLAALTVFLGAISVMLGVL